VKRFSWILTLPLIIVAVVFSVANREPITLDLWPFEYSSPPIPLSIALLASLVLGLLVGSLAAWLSAGRTRRRARQERRRADELERETARLRRERDRTDIAPPTGHAGSTELPAPNEDPGQTTERAKRSAIGS
jgi:uncharacterized integral membrane protein